MKLFSWITSSIGISYMNWPGSPLGTVLSVTASSTLRVKTDTEYGPRFFVSYLSPEGQGQGQVW